MRSVNPQTSDGDRTICSLGMLKKHVLSPSTPLRTGLVEGAASSVLAIVPDLRAHRIAALRGVRAHVLGVRSARQKGCGLARGKGSLGTLGIGRVK